MPDGATAGGGDFVTTAVLVAGKGGVTGGGWAIVDGGQKLGRWLLFGQEPPGVWASDGGALGLFGGVGVFGGVVHGCLVCGWRTPAVELWWILHGTGSFAVGFQVGGSAAVCGGRAALLFVLYLFQGAL